MKYKIIVAALTLVLEHSMAAARPGQASFIS